MFLFVSVCFSLFSLSLLPISTSLHLSVSACPRKTWINFHHQQLSCPFSIQTLFSSTCQLSSTVLCEWVGGWPQVEVMECKCAELSQQCRLCVCLCVCQAVVNPLQGFLGSCHSSRNISPGLSSLLLPWAASTVWKVQGGRRHWHRHTEGPSLIPSEAVGRAWAPCRDILGRDSNNPGANYRQPCPRSSAFFFFIFSFFISFLLPVSLLNSLSVCCCSNPWIIWVTLFLSLWILPSSVNSILPFHLLLHFLIILKLPASLVASPHLSSFCVPVHHLHLLLYCLFLSSPFHYYLHFIFTFFYVLLLPLTLSSPVA